MTYKQIYKLLRNSGHSPIKAAEIMLDATRGDQLAMDWVKTLFRLRHST
jgi:predicted ATPase